MRRASERGFTLAELTVAMVVGSLVLGAVYGLVVSQSRQYRRQAEAMEVRETLRGGIELLAAELRAAGPGRGDLQAIASQSLKLRSIYAAADVCVVSAAKDKYGIWAPQGTFEALNDADSALVFDGAWTELKLVAVWDNPGATGVPKCDWPSQPRPELVVEVTPIGAGNGSTGSLLQLFRVVEYGIYSAGGRWWLGRKQWDESAYTMLAGPLRSPSDSGLAFHYYDASGAETADPAQVTRVRIVIRGESQNPTDPRQESLSTTIRLRN